MIEKSGSVLLKAGRNPIRLEWFNGLDSYGLEAEYEGPALPRCRIPDAVRFRLQTNPATGSANWVNGLIFRCCEVSGQALPEMKTRPCLIMIVASAGIITACDRG